MRMRRIRGGPPLLDGLGADGPVVHEPRDSHGTHPPALRLKRGVDARAPVGAPRLRMDHPDLGDQPSILHRPATLGPSRPGIVAQ
jgi:hypothetical protein